MISSILELSTSHVTKEDSEKLTEESGLPIRYPYEWGWFVFVPEDTGDLIEAITDMQDLGYSMDAMKLFLHAHTKGHRFLRLDADADIIEGFPTHSW
jgi:hypothetical protein